MKRLTSLLLIIACLFGQEKVWVLLETGNAQFLNPYENDWEPITGKEQILSKTYLMTHSGAKTSVFNQNNRIDIPDDAYIYVADLFKQSKMDIIAALVQIDAEQLPTQINEKKSERKFGVTFGATRQPVDRMNNREIKQRFNAINFYESIGQNGTAVLTMRRLMMKYPDYAFDPNSVLRLMRLYIDLNLDGYAYETSNSFIHSMKTDQIPDEIVKLNDLIKKKLIDSN